MNFELRTSNFFGVDVGGTTTRVGAIDQNGRLLIADRFPTPDSTELLLDRVLAGVETLSWACAGDRVEPDSIGVALPGPIDRDRGVLVRSVNLPFLESVPIAELVQQRTGLNVVLCTDADAATWGEFSVCKPQPDRFVHLRFGTGIACGMVVHGKLQPIAAGRKTHEQALVVDDRTDAAPCVCGLRGCLELFASGPAIQRRASDLRIAQDLVGLQARLDAGDGRAHSFLQEIAGEVVVAIQKVGYPLPDGRGFDRGGDATVVSIGGGVVTALPGLYDAIVSHWRQAGRSQPGVHRAQVCAALLGDDAGVIGAALLSRTT